MTFIHIKWQFGRGFLSYLLGLLQLLVARAIGNTRGVETGRVVENARAIGGTRGVETGRVVEKVKAVWLGLRMW